MRPAHKTRRRPRVRPAVERGATGRSARRLPSAIQPGGQAAVSPDGRASKALSQGEPGRKQRIFKGLRARCLTRSMTSHQGGSVARTQAKLGRGGKGGAA